MLIQDMTREMSVGLLKRTRVGRLGCAESAQPYVVPLSFAYRREFLYGFATIGRKIEWMRANPAGLRGSRRDCQLPRMATVVIFGRYQELPNAPGFPCNAHGRARPNWLRPRCGGIQATSRPCTRAKNGRSSRYIFGFQSARFPATKACLPPSALTRSTARGRAAIPASRTHPYKWLRSRAVAAERPT